MQRDLFLSLSQSFTRVLFEWCTARKRRRKDSIEIDDSDRVQYMHVVHCETRSRGRYFFRKGHQDGNCNLWYDFWDNEVIHRLFLSLSLLLLLLLACRRQWCSEKCVLEEIEKVYKRSNASVSIGSTARRTVTMRQRIVHTQTRERNDVMASEWERLSKTAPNFFSPPTKRCHQSIQPKNRKTS